MTTTNLPARHAGPTPGTRAHKAPVDRPPVLRFLLLFAALLAVATGLAALSAAAQEPAGPWPAQARADTDSPPSHPHPQPQPQEKTP